MVNIVASVLHKLVSLGLIESFCERIKTAYHVITGVIHVVHVIFEELTSRHKFCIHCLPRRESVCVCVHKEKTFRLIALGIYSHEMK